MTEVHVRKSPVVPRFSSFHRFALCLALLAPLPLANAAPYMASGGSGHTQVLDADGSIWAWGYNKYGAVGDGSTVDVLPHAQATPRKALIDDVIAIASGQAHSLAVKSDGSVWTWGYGYLGHGAYEGRIVPTQVAGLENIKQVASGLYHNLALMHDGRVIGWGNNSRGAVGDGTTTHRASPVMTTLNDVIAIAANGHSLALKSDGTVWAWGENNAGQTGDAAGVTVTPRQIADLEDVIAIAAGNSHSVALKSDGTVWSWGEGVALGDGSFAGSLVPVRAYIEDVVAIAAGSGFTLALREDGSLWTFGITGYEGGSYTAASLPMPVFELENVSAIGAGWEHRIAILGDGSVYTWGMNDVGQLGNGASGNAVNSPARVAGTNGGFLALQVVAERLPDDRLFDWAEWHFPHMFYPHTESSIRLGYYARCYATGLCIGTSEGKAYLYDGTIRYQGEVEEMLELHAIPAGF